MITILSMSWLSFTRRKWDIVKSNTLCQIKYNVKKSIRMWYGEENEPLKKSELGMTENELLTRVNTSNNLLH